MSHKLISQNVIKHGRKIKDRIGLIVPILSLIYIFVKHRSKKSKSFQILKYLKKDIHSSKTGYYGTTLWKATSSNSTNTPLTNTKVLNRGIYVVNVSVPVMSTDLLCSLCSISGNIAQRYIYFPTGNASASLVLQIDETSETIYVKSEQSKAVTFSNIERGGIRIVCISDKVLIMS